MKHENFRINSFFILLGYYFPTPGPVYFTMLLVSDLKECCANRLAKVPDLKYILWFREV